MVIIVFSVIPIVLMSWPWGHMVQFRITNASGKEIAVTSRHTHKTVRILDQKAATIPHALGDIEVALPDGKTWVYRNFAPLDLQGTPFMVTKEYVFFGVKDGYAFSTSSTLNLLFNKDGHLYAVSPNPNDMDVEKMEQPEGFPLKGVLILDRDEHGRR